MRELKIDIAKGLGIIFVVFGHLGTPNNAEVLSLLKNVIYQFHMPLFYFLAGVFYKSDEKWDTFIWKKIKRLYFPYIGVNIFFTLYAIFQSLLAGASVIPVDMVKHCIKICLFMADSSFGSATWFLFILLITSILFKLLDNTVKLCCSDNKAKWIKLSLVIVFSIIGFSVEMPLAIQRAFVALLFYWAGNEFCMRLFNKIIDRSNLVLCSIGVAFCTAIVFAISRVNPISMVECRWGNPLLFVVSAFFGIIGVLVISKFINQLSNKVTAFFVEIGKESMSIMCGHLFAMYIFLVAVTRNVFIHFNEVNYWWQTVGCLICGVGLPFFATISWRKVISILR